MAMEAALERSGPDRDDFIRWLSAADPKLAATVMVLLSEKPDSGTQNED